MKRRVAGSSQNIRLLFLFLTYFNSLPAVFPETPASQAREKSVLKEEGAGLSQSRGSGWSLWPQGELALSRRRASGCPPGASLTWVWSPISGEATANFVRAEGGSVPSAAVKR